jgi:ribosomal protein L31E
MMLSGSAQANVAGDLIQDVEWRTQYNIDEKDYNNTLRFKLGTLNSGNKNKILDLETQDEQSNIFYINAEMNILMATNNKKIKLAQKWRRDLSRVYVAYKEYLKSSPSSANSSTDVKASSFFALSEESISDAPKVKLGRALKNNFNDSDLANISLREANRLSFSKKADKADNSIVKFAEVSFRGDYDDSVENETVVRLGISLPLGFTGERVEKRKKRLANQYKIKRIKAQKELQFKKAVLDIKLKKRLFEKMSANRPTKSRLKKITSSSSLSAEDKLKIYLESIESEFKRIELKAELALLHNTVLALMANPNKDKYIGAGL